MSKAHATIYRLLWTEDHFVDIRQETFLTCILVSVFTVKTSLVTNGYAFSHTFSFYLLIFNKATSGVVIGNNMGEGVLKGRKKKPIFISQGVLEVCLHSCLTSCGCSAFSKPWIEEERVGSLLKSAYERVTLRKLVPWLGETE